MKRKEPICSHSSISTAEEGKRSKARICSARGAGVGPVHLNKFPINRTNEFNYFARCSLNQSAERWHNFPAEDARSHIIVIPHWMLRNFNDVYSEGETANLNTHFQHVHSHNLSPASARATLFGERKIRRAFPKATKLIAFLLFTNNLN